eukprot:2670817-Alexandrium_andersonii.AAC.1
MGITAAALRRRRSLPHCARARIAARNPGVHRRLNRLARRFASALSSYEADQQLAMIAEQVDISDSAEKVVEDGD